VRTTTGALLAAVLLVSASEARPEPTPTVAAVRNTLQTMRERRAAADEARGGSLAELNEQRRQAAAAQAAQQAARRAARKRRSRGFPLVVFVREVGEGLFGRDGAVRGAVTVARGVHQEVRNAARHVAGPVGEIFEQVDRVRQRVIQIAKRPFRPIFDRTGLFGELLEEFADLKAGDAWDSRMRRTGLGRTRARIEDGAVRLNDRLEEISGMLDEIDANRQDIDALWSWLTGIDNPRAREILQEMIEERLGVDFDEVSQRLGNDAARDNVRRGARGVTPKVVPGPGMEGRGPAPMPPPVPRVEGRGRRYGR
jgi:hypothetical protein